MRQTLLIVGGGIETVPGIRLAKEMGCFVIVSDIKAQAPGMAIADAAIIASTYDAEATVHAARKCHHSVRRIDGVMCLASDIPLTVAAVAEDLGLAGIPVQTAQLAMDKLAMKRKFTCDGVPVPWFGPLESAAHLQHVVAETGYPLVLKPVDSRGARGVIRLTPEIDLKWAYEASHRYSPTGRVMVERFLSGPQVSTESIVLEGKAYTVGFSDRNYEFLDRFAPHIIENGGDLPSHLAPDVQQAVKELVQKAALSLGVRQGTVKGDIVIHENQPFVIELAARLSGGYFCTHEIPLNTGVEFVRCAIKMALGERVDPEDVRPRFQRPVCQRYLFPKPGRVARISGVDSVARRAEIAFCQITVSENAIVGPIDNHPARAGVVIATGNTRQAARKAAEAAITDIHIETDPL
ncbi:MAG: ATP-grasp domain-containing protein [bacterium]